MKCPHCKDQNLVMSERKGVEIDYCPECRGVWLDRGELDKILDRSREEEVVTMVPQSPQKPLEPARPYGASDEYHNSKHYKKRRKSFLEELFD